MVWAPALILCGLFSEPLVHINRHTLQDRDNFLSPFILSRENITMQKEE